MEEKVNIESFIEEMTKVRPEVLTPEAKKLFDTIMQILDENLLLKESLKDKCDIADERNQLLIDKQKLNKVIDEITEYICEHVGIYDYLHFYNRVNGKDCEMDIEKDKKKNVIKQFFIKKVEEQNKAYVGYNIL